jgi:acetyl/propionyl-CoA carboxylase alpha subunit
MTAPTVLVANRGEIALRVMRTCRELGLRTVGVYAPVDRRAPHVACADAAFPLPGDAPHDSYLNVPALLEIAQRAGAQAVHPGYGFLAEEAAFARACDAAHLRFVGPPAEVLARCGDKVETRAVAAASGVPVLPGTGPVEDAELAAAAARVGFPLLVKAAGGGGGKGIHLVRDLHQLTGTARLARGEAVAAFGDPRLYLERWLDRARHIEVQILADPRGRVVTLGERECSIQRRHQKLIEESPAPNLAPQLRQRLTEAARAVAAAIRYRNAGTCEFLVFGDEFYFLEINARLQVEHPVTEMITGIDLVAEQLHVALEDRTHLSSRDVRPSGHAIECRIGAEDPHEGFFPAAGRIEGVLLPGGPGIRVDAAVQPDMVVSRHYDPLLAKLVAWGPERPDAIARMHRALTETAVDGIPTTIPFHVWAVRQPSFVDGRYDTGFITQWEERRPDPAGEHLAALAAAATAYMDSVVGRPPSLSSHSRWQQAAREEGLR